MRESGAPSAAPPDWLPLIEPNRFERTIAWRGGERIDVARFEQHVDALASRLPRAIAMIDLCEDRYRFLVAYAAALLARNTLLLPSSRAEQVVAELQAAHPGSFRCDDAFVEPALEAGQRHLVFDNRVAPDRVAVISYTSGSTGAPKACAKSWRALLGSTERSAARIRAALPAQVDRAAPGIVATVPPQHMFGMEFSVLLPLVAGMAVHAGRPLFAADIAAALVQLSEPRILVTTPVHLRTIVESRESLPSVQLIVSSTAPLDAVLAQAAEARLGAPLLEILGSTETGAFASRYTAREVEWQLYAGVAIEPVVEGTSVSAAWFDAPAILQDTLEAHGPERFTLQGRNADMIDVAGKRASLADLTRRLLAIEGVVDAVVFQPAAPAVAAIRRVAALVVAPGLTSAQILERLSSAVDPVFLPRPLVLVGRLPRDAVGKLPRERLLAALAEARC